MIGNFATTNVVTTHPTTPIREVARLMAQHRVGLVVLVDAKDPFKTVGVVSERDVVRAVAYEIDLEAPAETIATKNVVTIDHSEHVAKAAEAFRKHGIRHVVVTKDGKLYGVLSIRDLIREEAVLRELAAYYEWTFEPGMTA